MSKKSVSRKAKRVNGDLVVEQWPTAKPKPYPRNPRHNEAAVAKVAASIRAFGFRQPLVVDEQGVIIAGHTRLLAARQLGLPTVPVHVARGLTPAQVRAYRLADNRTAQESSWDNDALVEELLALKAEDYDLGLTAFNPDELDALLAPNGGLLDGVDPDDVPPLPATPITKPGDLITLGRHRLLCGDSTKAEDVARLIGGDRAQMAYNDPPYGVEIVGKSGRDTTGLPPGPALCGSIGAAKPFGKVGSIDRGMKARPIIPVNFYAPIIGDESTRTAIAAFGICAELKIPVLIFWGGNYYADHLPPSSCWVVWDKDNGESFLGDAELAWTNQKTAVRIFKHQWNGLMKGSERGQKRVHPTQKPVALAEWCFAEYGAPADKVLDLFCGSGSALIAAEKTGRACYAMELSPAYCDVIVARWEAATGQKAVRPRG